MCHDSEVNAAAKGRLLLAMMLLLRAMASLSSTVSKNISV